MSETTVRFKKGVTVNGIQPEIAAIIPAVASVFHRHSYPCVITSITDGVHSKNSLHYAGLAIDFRTRFIQDQRQKEAITQAIRDALTDEFDVVLESTHIHVEFDPK